MRNFAPEINKHDDFVAQLVEQLTLNQWVESSSLSEVTKVNGSSFLNFHFFIYHHSGSSAYPDLSLIVSLALIVNCEAILYLFFSNCTVRRIFAPNYLNYRFTFCLKVLYI